MPRKAPPKGGKKGKASDKAGKKEKFIPFWLKKKREKK